MICPNCEENNVRVLEHIDLGTLEEWVFCPDCGWRGTISKTGGNVGTDIENLSYEAIECQSRRVDWEEAAFIYHESCGCEECGTITHEDPCHECNTRTYLSGPMMNFFYPLPRDWEPGENTVDVLAHLPLCLVGVAKDGTAHDNLYHCDLEWGLALTGGGMDLTWEICEAYIALRYYPPFQFCDLPGMAGIEDRENYHEIVTTCLKTCEAIGARAARMTKCLINRFVDKGVE